MIRLLNLSYRLVLVAFLAFASTACTTVCRNADGTYSFRMAGEKRKKKQIPSLRVDATSGDARGGQVRGQGHGPRVPGGSVPAAWMEPRWRDAKLSGRLRVPVGAELEAR